MKKSFWLIAAMMGAMLCMMLCLAGCGAVVPDPVEPEEAPDPYADRTPVIGARTLEDGRKTGGVAKGRPGDELTNIFFAFSVDKVELAAEYEDNKPDRGYAYLIADLTVTNATDKPITMWADDFLLQWGDGDNDYGYPEEKFTETQMEAEFRLNVGQSVTKSVLYEVPVPEGENEYNISYVEFYDDKVEGNTFYVIFNLAP